MDLPPDSRTALRDWLTEQLADLLGEPLADVRALADDDDLLGCGLDSIRLMYLNACRACRTRRPCRWPARRKASASRAPGAWHSSFPPARAGAWSVLPRSMA